MTLIRREGMAVYAEYQPRRSWRERWHVGHLSDVVLWRAVVAPGVVLQKHQYSLQRSYAMRGPDLRGEPPEVQGAIMLQANEVLKRLGGQHNSPLHLRWLAAQEQR